MAKKCRISIDIDEYATSCTQTPTLVKDGSKTLAPAATIFRIVFF